MITKQTSVEDLISTPTNYRTLWCSARRCSPRILLLWRTRRDVCALLPRPSSPACAPSCVELARGTGQAGQRCGRAAVAGA